MLSFIYLLLFKVKTPKWGEKLQMASGEKAEPQYVSRRTAKHEPPNMIGAQRSHHCPLWVPDVHSATRLRPSFETPEASAFAKASADTSSGKPAFPALLI